MSVSLLIKDAKDAEQRLVPIAAEAIFRSRWLPGVHELGLEWVELMATGFDVTSENHREILEELLRLREWMAQGGDTLELERLDRLATEMRNIRFEVGATAFIG